MKLRLTDLADMHPGLLWDDIAAALLAVLEDRRFPSPYSITINTENIPGYGSNELELHVVRRGIVRSHVERVRRTYESHRLVELAAIATAGLALYAAGGHIIRDIAVRGSAADYLVDEQNYLLEIAGRTRRSDFESAWQARMDRLTERQAAGYFVCVVEFETPSGRLTFAN